jgi:ribosomal protein S18 acetylase RimI-like enzyme
MASSEGLVRRALKPSDIDGGAALSAEAGWNQVPADWRLMLERGEGIAVSASDGTLVATALTHSLGPIGWISMVLVARAYRRRGIATDLIEGCVDLLRQKGIIPGLDATEAGRLVYEPLGFRPVYALARGVASGLRSDGTARGDVRPARAADLVAIAAYDRRAFGLDRAHILRSLQARAPDLALVAETSGALRGFVLGRDGRRATQVGPLMADDPETAIGLAQAALARTVGPVYVDSLDGQHAFNDYLVARGFAVQRGFTRMLVGRSEPFDDPRRCFAIAGPELA